MFLSYIKHVLPLYAVFQLKKQSEKWETFGNQWSEYIYKWCTVQIQNGQNMKCKKSNIEKEMRRAKNNKGIVLKYCLVQ